MALRYDISRLQPVKRLADGRIRADAHLTRCGVFEYHQPDGSVRRELRLPEEVFKPESLESFRQAPVTDDHPPEMVNSRNAKKYTVGSLGDTLSRDADHMRGSISVYDAETVAKMEAGKLDVSCGYNCDLEESPGTHPIYGKYDAVQRNIVGNHVAIVDRGRAGTAKVRMDAAWSCPEENVGTILARGDSHAIIVPMATVTDIKVVARLDDESLAALKAHADAKGGKGAKGKKPDDDDPEDPDDADDDDPDDEGDDADDPNDDETRDSADAPRARRSTKHMSDLKKAQDDLAAEKARADQATKDLDTARAQLAAEKVRADKADEALKSARKDADDKFPGAVKARVALETEANTILGAADKAGKAIDRSGLSDRDLRCAVIKHVDSVDIAKEESDDFVRAYYTSALSRARKDAQDTIKGAEALAGARQTIEETRQDAANTDAIDDEVAAAKKARARTTTAWAQSTQETK